jgi:hypothetical protein
VLAVERLEHGLHDSLEDRRLILVVPHVLEDEEIARVGGRAAVEVGARREQLEELHDASIDRAHALGADLEDEALVCGQERVAEGHALAERATELGELARGHDGRLHPLLHLPDLELDAALQQLVEVVRVEVVRVHAQQEAVEDRGERLVGGDLVRGREHAAQRARMTWPPLVYLRSFNSVSSAFRMALFDLKTSSRKTISASGNMPAVLRR